MKMKTLKLFVIGLVFFITATVTAQVSINVNIGSPPEWGPVGYSEVEYYYLPDIEVYYDIHETEFIFFSRGRWIRSRYLPSHCRNYDLYNGYKVVLTDYHGGTPYVYFKNHKVKYYKGFKHGSQRTIGRYKEDDKREYKEYKEERKEYKEDHKEYKKEHKEKGGKH
jgi:hypothetical protein